MDESPLQMFILNSLNQEFQKTSKRQKVLTNISV